MGLFSRAVAGLTILGVAGYLNACSPIASTNQTSGLEKIAGKKEMVKQAAYFFERFPDSIPGSVIYGKIKAENARHTLVYVRNLHPVFTFGSVEGDQKDDLLKAGNDELASLEYLVDSLGVKEVYIEGMYKENEKEVKWEFTRDSAYYEEGREKYLFDFGGWGARRYDRKSEHVQWEDLDSNIVDTLITSYVYKRGSDGKYLDPLEIDSASAYTFREIIPFSSSDSIPGRNMKRVTMDRFASSINQRKGLEDKDWVTRWLGAPAWLFVEGKIGIKSAEIKKVKEKADAVEGYKSFSVENAPKELLGDREDVVLKLVSENNDPVAVVSYGKDHVFTDNVAKWNRKNPNDQFNLIVLTPNFLYEQEKIRY